MFVKSVIIPNFFSTAYILRKIALLSLTGDIICITKQLWSHITSHESAKSATGSWRSSGHLFSRDLDVWKQIRMKRLFGKNMESYQRECPKRWRVLASSNSLPAWRSVRQIYFQLLNRNPPSGPRHLWNFHSAHVKMLLLLLEDSY